MLVKVFLRLLLASYGVAVLGLAVIALMGAWGDPSVVGSFWDQVGFAAFAVSPFALTGAVMATLLYWVGARWWDARWGRFTYALLCAAIGAAQLILPSGEEFLPIGVLAAGTAAWIATWPEGRAPLLPQLGLAAAAGLVSGVLVILLWRYL